MTTHRLGLFVRFGELLVQRHGVRIVISPGFHIEYDLSISPAATFIKATNLQARFLCPPQLPRLGER